MDDLSVRNIDTKYAVKIEVHPTRTLRPIIFKRSTTEEIPEDEPLFLLRARDPLAAQAIRMYAVACRAASCTPGQVASCETIAKQFDEWLASHPEKSKMPGSTL